MASSLKSLKRAASYLPPPPAQKPRNDYYAPIFSEDEIEEINELKCQAEAFSKYGGEGWFDRLVEEETVLASDSLEGCIDPLEVLTSHWSNAIETGKLYQERAFCHDKAMMMANTLEHYVFIEMKSARHYLECAMNPKLLIGISLIRVREVLLEFQNAYNEQRRVCMCKQRECCCLLVSH